MNNSINKIILTVLLSFIIFSVNRLDAIEYHVSKKGHDTNPGTASKPYRTISKAVKVAMPGDIVTVHEGIYREEIKPPRGGTSDKKRIVYQAAQGENVEIRGSEIVNNWTKVNNDIWKTEVPNSLFGDFNPFADEVSGDWFKPKGRKHHTGCVYQDGEWLFEAASIDKLLDNKKSTHQMKKTWFAEVNDKITTIWAFFDGEDPNKNLTEINVRQTIFYPRKPFINYITVRGFKMSHAAPKWAPPTAEQMGLIGTHWSKGWIIENNKIMYSINVGISLGKYGDKHDNTRMEYRAYQAEEKKKGNIVKSYYIESVERARRDMQWNRETIGSHIIRNNEISYCEQAGIVGSMGASFSQVVGNHIHHIHIQGRFTGAEMAGIKFHAPIDMLIKGNRIHDTNLALWLDWMTQGTRVSANLMYNNGMDLYFEVNHGPFLIDNNICLSQISRHLSQGGAYVHNLFNGKWGNWKDGRETPYFKPHSTEKVNDHYMDIGDDRFYNNLFIGKGKQALIIVPNKQKKIPFYWSYGLKCYEYRPQLPATGGNVYYKGALPCSNETAMVLGVDPKIKLEEKDDEVFLHIIIDKEQQKSKNTLVTTKLLGKAEVPQQEFTHADGSPLKINTDYLGNKRAKTNPSSGPFENIKAGRQTVKVWPKN